MHAQKKGHTMKSLIYTVCLLVLLSCCQIGNKQADAQLDQAEALMTEQPDSALTILQQVDDTRLTTKALQARFALLLSMALDKNYIDIASDSLIRPAVEYYENHGSSKEKMLTCYYLANVLYNAKETAKCLISLTDAEKYAKSIEDHFYLGMIYRMMADAYNDIYCRNEELKYRQLSYDSFQLSGSQRHIDFAYLDLGRAYSNNYEYDKSIDIYNEALKSAESSSDTYIIIHSLSGLGHTHRLKHNYKESIQNIKKLESLFSKNMQSKDYRNLARDYAALQMSDSAKYYMQKAEAMISNSLDTQVTYRILYEISKYDKDYKTALENHEKLFELNSYITDSIMGKSVLVTMQDYIVQQAEYDNYVATQKRNYLYFIITFLIIGITATSIIFYQRWQNKNQEIEKNLQLAQSIRDTLQIKESQLSDMGIQIQSLFSQQFNAIDELCNIYFESKDTKTEKDRIYKEVMKQINDLGTNKVSQLEGIINTYKNQLMTDFRKDFQGLHTDVYQLATYLFSGFSSRAISIFMDEKIENIYNRKSRLKNRVQNSDSPRREEYLSLFD